MRHNGMESPLVGLRVKPTTVVLHQFASQEHSVHFVGSFYVHAIVEVFLPLASGIQCPHTFFFRHFVQALVETSIGWMSVILIQCFIGIFRHCKDDYDLSILFANIKSLWLSSGFWYGVALDLPML
jgi:hypothetical protein